MAKRETALLAAAVVAVVGSAAMGTSAIPSEKEHVISLDGVWRFKLEQGSDFGDVGNVGGNPNKMVLPATFEPFEKTGYKEGSEWKELKVPGNWEIAGFSPPNYNQPDNAIGIYRKWVNVPKEWAGRVVKVNFDGVQNAAEVYLNGQPVNVDEPSEGKANYHQGGFNAFQADLTPAVKYGEKNLLAIRVYKNVNYVNMDTGDFFFMGGIHRTVTMFAVPKVRIEDYKVETKLIDGGKAEVKVIATVVGGKGEVSMKLEGEDGVKASADGSGRATLVKVVEKPKLWSAEHPNLYSMSLDLKSGDGGSEHIDGKVGIREVSIKDGVLLVNGVPVKLTGICRHDLYADLGSALTEEAWRKDITMMKAANINAIRTSHYPYGSKFYELCDEIGMYVADEEAAGWVPTDEERLFPAFAQHAREVVRRDKNHPSVIIWAVGNENKSGPANKIAADEMKKLDTTRPRLVSWRKAEDNGSNVELDDLHYTDPAKIQKLNDDKERRKKYPMIFLENPNVWEARNGADWGCTDQWGEVMTRSWDVIWNAKHVPGSFLWEWADRAVVDQSPKKLYDYDPATGVHLVKVKGLVDTFRNPRPWLYHVKMAYAPVTVDPKADVSADSITLGVTNRYSFTNVGELTTTWQLVGMGEKVAEGTVKADVAPLSNGKVNIPVTASAMGKADTLRVGFVHPDGRNVATYEVKLKEDRRPAPTLDAGGVAGLKFPKLNFTTADFPRNKIGWKSADRHPMVLKNVRVNGKEVKDDAALYAMSLGDVAKVDADVVFKDKPDEVVANLQAGQKGGHFKYTVNWVAKEAGDVQELGWVFDVPAGADRFSWKREALWSWYPEDHIGRARGTATPDSVKDQHFTKTTRADAFDFVSTKFNCDWATMTDGAGKGLGVKFGEKQRHQVRGDLDGGVKLVVNKQCSPPRDLSSGIVSDYFLKLNKGATVNGEFEVGTLK